MLLECSYCEAKVEAEIVASIQERDDGEPPCRVSLLRCPSCKRALLAVEDCIGFRNIEDDEGVWDDAVRLWPKPKNNLYWQLPNLVRISIEEAEKCYNAKAYYACAVMCGRTLESICSEHTTKKQLLAGGLKELLDKHIIDARIYEWGDALRKHRNIGAHATEEKITREDAKDLLEFANAICDYIFILTSKFEKFKERTAEKKKARKKK